MELTSSFVSELKRRARRMVRKGARQPIDADSLVQEACIKLLATRGTIPADREEALAYAARVLRNALVDQAQRRGAQKRGAGARRERLEDVQENLALDRPDLDTALDVHAGLQRLARVDDDLARLVEQRYFGRYTCREIAAARGVPAGVIEERLRAARRWLEADFRSRELA